MSDVKYVPLSGARSKVWKFFGFKTKDGHNIDPDHKDVVFCTVHGCRKSVPYLKQTTNLTTHLRLSHPMENATLLGETTSPTSKTVASYFMAPTDVKKINLNSLRHQFLTDGIVDYLTMDMRPFTSVEGAGFRNMLHRCCQSIHSPAQITIRVRSTIAMH